MVYYRRSCIIVFPAMPSPCYLCYYGKIVLIYIALLFCYQGEFRLPHIPHIFILEGPWKVLKSPWIFSWLSGDSLKMTKGSWKVLNIFRLQIFTCFCKNLEKKCLLSLSLDNHFFFQISCKRMKMTCWKKVKWKLPLI